MIVCTSEYTGNVCPVQVVTGVAPVVARILAYCAVFEVAHDVSCGSANAEAPNTTVRKRANNAFMLIPLVWIGQARTLIRCTPTSMVDLVIVGRRRWTLTSLLIT